jgi:membrane associated rhomboid family serine protease
MTYEKIAHEPADRTCAFCGNLTPADRVDCIHCGMQSPELLTAQQEAVKKLRFVEAVFTRPFQFTVIFIGINVGIFALMWLTGGMSVMTADRDILVAFGAKVNPLIREQHQYWRLVTSMFVHIGLLHLAFNMYALWIIGQQIEQLYGAARFVLLYFACGLVGSLASLFFSNAVSAGASGSIFGLFGVMAAFGFRYRKELPGGLGNEITRRVLPIIAINLIFGFSTKIVDNAAHLGGLLTGVALCLLIPYKRPEEKGGAVVWRVLQIICLTATLVSFVEAFRRYDGPRLSLANVTAKPGDKIARYYSGMREAANALGLAINDFNEILNNRSGSKDKEAASINRILNRIARGLQAAQNAPSLNSEADAYRQRLLNLLTEQKNILDNYAQHSSPSALNTAKAEETDLGQRFDQFIDEFQPWLIAFLKQQGYQLKPVEPDDR